MSRSVPIVAVMLIVTVLASGAWAQRGGRVTITVDPKAPVVVERAPPYIGPRPSVDVAILLDTSNSMDGLIRQAKSQLWTIVQQFAKAKKDGQTPTLRVALFEYGNTRLPASEGYLRQVVPLTDDLDKLSQALFSLTTSGGDEYCGQVIDEAVKRLDWSKEPRGYKAIFIAGNEPFTQGSVDYREACRRAIDKGVVVNTIHCGRQAEGISGKWADGAKLAEGEFFNIDQDRAVIQIRAPQDEIIIKLGSELNNTYLWYGAAEVRREYHGNQAQQDSNAHYAGGGAEAARASIKAGAAYSNRGRDLVDDYNASQKMPTLKDAELPEELAKLPPEKREAYVQEIAAKRGAIQKQINDLSVEREKYLAAEKAKPAAGGDATLGDAVVTSIQKQLSRNGFVTEADKK